MILQELCEELVLRLMLAVIQYCQKGRQFSGKCSTIILNFSLQSVVIRRLTLSNVQSQQTKTSMDCSYRRTLSCFCKGTSKNYKKCFDSLLKKLFVFRSFVSFGNFQAFFFGFFCIISSKDVVELCRTHSIFYSSLFLVATQEIRQIF